MSLYEHSNLPAAISLLLECRKTDDKRNLLCHTRKLVELLQKSGQQSRYEQELHDLILEQHCLEIPYVSQQKAITPPDDWPHMLAQLFSIADESRQQLDLLCFEGMYDALLSELTRHRSLHTFLVYEEPLRLRVPGQTMELYISLLKEEMDHNCDRNMYRRTIAHLPRLHQYPDGSNAAHALALFWFHYHKNRPAMKDELCKAGYR